MSCKMGRNEAWKGTIRGEIPLIRPDRDGNSKIAGNFPVKSGVLQGVHNQRDEGHIRGTTGDCERKHTRRSTQSKR
jgi:hypothetical protein